MKSNQSTFSLSRAIFSIGLLAMFLVLSACGGKTIEEHDDHGNLLVSYAVKEDSIKHGKYIAYHEDGSVFEESTYVDGHVHGVRMMYYEGDKKIKTLENYDNGEMKGLFEEYHLNGQVSFSGMFVEGSMEGVFKKYSESGQLIEEVTFADSEENGPFKEYHLNGQLAAEGAYKHGDNEDGQLKLYDEDGELIKEMLCDVGVCRTTWEKETVTN